MNPDKVESLFNQILAADEIRIDGVYHGFSISREEIRYDADNVVIRIEWEDDGCPYEVNITEDILDRAHCTGDNCVKIWYDGDSMTISLHKVRPQEIKIDWN